MATISLGNNIILTTLGAEHDNTLVNFFAKAKREKNNTIQIIDLHRNPSLDEWEYELDDPLPVAVLLRNGVEVPTTFAGSLTKQDFPFPGEGQLHKANGPSYTPTFSPGWKFPDWLRKQLPRLDATKKQYSFDDLYKAGFVTLLMEYAGYIERGNDFRLEPGSPICENIRLYLRRKFGGYKGIERKVEEWITASDIMNQENLLIPQNGRYQTMIRYNGEVDYVLATRSVYERNRFPDMEKVKEIIWNSTFMGSCDEIGVANLTTESFTFLHPTLNRRVRKYHEGNPRITNKRMYIDTDPSDMTVCSAIRGQGTFDYDGKYEMMDNIDDASSKKYRLEAPPEGTVFFEPQEWHPGPEHQEMIIKRLMEMKSFIRGLEIPAGWYKLPYHPTKNLFQAFYALKHDFDPKKEIKFISSKDWIRHWDANQKKMVPGASEKMSQEEKSTWTYASGGYIYWYLTKDEEVKSFFFKASMRPDVLPSKKSRQDLQKLYEEGKKLPHRALLKFLVPKKPTEDNPEGGWQKPYSFRGRNNQTIHISPRPAMFDNNSWNIYNRSWTALEVVRKLLAEERWEKLAYDLNPIGTEDRTQEINPIVAARKIRNHIMELVERVKNACDEDVSKNFETEALGVFSFVLKSVHGEREASPKVTLETMNPVQGIATKRRTAAIDPVHSMMLEADRTLWSICNSKAKKSQIHKQLADRILERVKRQPNKKVRYQPRYDSEGNKITVS